MKRILAACLVLAVITAIGENTSTNKPHSGIENMQWSMVRGLEMGYECRSLGGTTNDLEILCQAVRDSKPQVVKDWFQTHRDWYLKHRPQ